MTEDPPGPDGPESPPGDLRAVSLLALRLGVTAFGGPAAHIAMLRDEVVNRRRWLTDRQFLDLLGATNLIPGPNSTEMVMHVGMERAGWRGLLAAGSLFILPAAAITLAFAWAYARYGTTPEADWLLYGVKPVVIAVVVQAIWGLGRTSLSTPWTVAAGVATAVLALAGVNELALLLGMGALLGLAAAIRGGPLAAALAILWVPGSLDAIALAVVAAATAPYSPFTLFWRFLKIGATLYGSGYVLLAFLQQDFVDDLGWLTGQQLIDAVAVGQFTPGPVFTTATFVGYLVGGFQGAALATVAIFLPAFLLVRLTHRLVPRIRSSPIASGFLDGVNAAAVALMAVVAWQLSRSAIVDAPTALLAAGAAVLLIRFRVNSALLIALGAAAGFLLHRFGGG